jgi:RHS repeat-associated protein
VDFEYTYDDNGNILTQKFHHRDSQTPPYNDYGYDDLNRLITSDYLVGHASNWDEAFDYDLLGNRDELFKNGVSQGTYAHDSANAYTSVLGTTVSHDLAGNLTKDHRGYCYIYDYENKVTRIFIDENTDSSYTAGVDTNIAEYTYDALGRRIERIDAVANVTTAFYYDDQRVIYEAETRPEGLEERVFAWGNYIDEALVMRCKAPGGNWLDYFYGHDHLYSVVCLFDAAGAPAERYEYDAYGKARIFTAGTDGQWFTADDAETIASSYGNPYTFTGRELDYLDGGSLQIMYFRTRTYDPQTGRFMQRDPLGINPAGGIKNPFRKHKQHIAGMNLYEYVKSNSLLGKDAFGLCGFTSRGIPTENYIEDEACGQTYVTWNFNVKVVPCVVGLCGQSMIIHDGECGAQATYWYYVNNDPDGPCKGDNKRHEERHVLQAKLSWQWLQIVSGLYMYQCMYTGKAQCYKEAIDEMINAKTWMFNALANAQDCQFCKEMGCSPEKTSEFCTAAEDSNMNLQLSVNWIAWKLELCNYIR